MTAKIGGMNWRPYALVNSEVFSDYLFPSGIIILQLLQNNVSQMSKMATHHKYILLYIVIYYMFKRYAQCDYLIHSHTPAGLQQPTHWKWCWRLTYFMLYARRSCDIELLNYVFFILLFFLLFYIIYSTLHPKISWIWIFGLQLVAG